MEKLNLEAVFDFKDISPKAQQHLSKVYGTLAMTLGACTTGVIIAPKLTYNFFIQLIAIVVQIYLVYQIHSAKKNTTKLYALMAIGFMTGMFMKPLVSYAIELDPAILINAIIITTSLFGALSLVALKVKQRSLLFLGGIASSILLWVSIASLLGWLFGFSVLSYMQYNVLMIGVFAMFTIYDTQLIIAKYEHGDTNHFSHALELFVDFIRLFIHIL